MEDIIDKEIEEKTNIIDKASLFVEKLFKEALPVKYLYHNYNHTEEVVSISEKIGKSEDIKKEEMEILLLSAWLHDIGYTKDYNNHEKHSADMAREFLESQDYSEEKTDKVVELILSTRQDHKPENKLEEILRDADIAHIGRKRFFRKGELLRIEMESFGEKEFSDLEWEEKQLDFLVSKKFYTTYAKDKYNARRAKNIQKQKSNIQKVKKNDLRIRTGKEMGRGIDTLYRVTFNNHIELSSIADGKANMMISLNTIILTVIITLAGSGLTFSAGFLSEQMGFTRFTFPIFVLLISSLTSVVFAVLSAKPKVTKQDVENEDVELSDKSILFFGNFVKMKLENFVEGVRKLKENQGVLYDKMSIDLYYLGIVLSKKYKLLSYSYLTFMIGLIIAVLSFIIIFFYTYQT